MYIYICIHMHIYIYIYIYVYVCVCVCVIHSVSRCREAHPILVDGFPFSLGPVSSAAAILPGFRADLVP